MMCFMRRLLWILLAVPAFAQQHWVATWGTAIQQYMAPPRPAQAPARQAAPPPTAAPGGPGRRFPIPPPPPTLRNQTVRMIVRTSIGGKTLRIRLSNAFGASTLTIGDAHIALREKDSAIIPASDQAITFSGKSTATIYAGQVLLSDPVNLEVGPSTDLAVTLFLPYETGTPSWHQFGLRPTYISREGDFANAREIVNPAHVMDSWVWLAGVDVLAPKEDFTIVTFGDSITDGDQSTPGAVHSWPSVFAARLQSSKRTSHIGVVNTGISGNRVLGDNGSALSRMLRDVFMAPGVRWVTLLEGINDITGATRPGAPASDFNAETLIAAYRQIIETAHHYGVKIAGCTITPYQGSTPYTEAGEAIRQAVNNWIRTSHTFDAVIDFDAAVRDPKAPARFRPEADSPDLLHPGDAGYKLMADSIDLSMFK
jgi:lysophospholipase L1-like esterase